MIFASPKPGPLNIFIYITSLSMTNELKTENNKKGKICKGSIELTAAF